MLTSSQTKPKEFYQMRKLMIILTLAVSGLTVQATLNADPPPHCAPQCCVHFK